MTTIYKRTVEYIAAVTLVIGYYAIDHNAYVDDPHGAWLYDRAPPILRLVVSMLVGLIATIGVTTAVRLVVHSRPGPRAQNNTRPHHDTVNYYLLALICTTASILVYFSIDRYHWAYVPGGPIRLDARDSTEWTWSVVFNIAAAIILSALYWYITTGIARIAARPARSS